MSPKVFFVVVSLVAEANVIAISVDYRLAPEYPIPIAYEDSWAALKWVASHCNGQVIFSFLFARHIKN